MSYGCTVLEVEAAATAFDIGVSWSLEDFLEQIFGTTCKKVLEQPCPMRGKSKGTTFDLRRLKNRNSKGARVAFHATINWEGQAQAGYFRRHQFRSGHASIEVNPSGNTDVVAFGIPTGDSNHVQL